MNQFEYVTDPDELFHYFYTGSYGEFFDVLTHPSFPWERLDDMLNSPRLTASRLKTLMAFIFMWDEKLVDFRVLLSNFLRLAVDDGSNSFDFSAFSFLRQAVDTDSIADRKGSPFVVPSFFVESIYDLYLEKVGLKLENEPLWWCLFVGYPTVSYDFKKKFWLEQRDTIVEVFTSDDWLEEMFIDTYVWDDVPPVFLLDLVSRSQSRAFVDLCTEKHAKVWREALLLGLKKTHDVNMLKVLPLSWLNELLFASDFAELGELV